MKYNIVCFLLLFPIVSFIGCNTNEIDRVVENAMDESIESNGNDSAICDTVCCDGDKENLLKNGGLEEWQTFPFQMATDWLLFDDDINIQKNSNIVYEGRYSARMQSRRIGSTARIDQLISVYPKQKIRIRFKYYIEQWKPKGARTYCYFRTERAEKYTLSIDELEDIYDKDTYYIFRGGGYG